MTDKTDKLVKAFLPTLLSFGPIFIVIGLQGGTTHSAGSDQWMFLFSHAFALLGALMLSIGVITIYVRQIRLEGKLHEMEMRTAHAQ